jgi:hypothetical protein
MGSRMKINYQNKLVIFIGSTLALLRIAYRIRIKERRRGI